MCRKAWKSTMLITIPRIRCWKPQWSNGSIARSRMTYGRCLRSTAITSGSTSCRVSCQTTRASTIGMRPAEVSPAIAERLLNTVYSAIKIAGPAKFKIGDSAWASTRRFFRRVTRQIGPPRCLRSLRYQSCNLFTRGLSRKIRRWSILRVRVASRYSSGRVSRGESTAQEGRQGVRQVAGIRWITQFMDTQKQCYLIKILIHVFYFYI